LPPPPGIRPVFCTIGGTSVAALTTLVRGKPLEPNPSAAILRYWHGSSEATGMIPLLFAFFALGALMCALISLDHHQPADAPKADRHHLENNTRLQSAEAELSSDAAVESGRTVAGFARGQ